VPSIQEVHDQVIANLILSSPVPVPVFVRQGFLDLSWFLPEVDNFSTYQIPLPFGNSNSSSSSASSSISSPSSSTTTTFSPSFLSVQIPKQFDPKASTGNTTLVQRTLSALEISRQRLSALTRVIQGLNGDS
jgi:hypothetical protein